MPLGRHRTALGLRTPRKSEGAGAVQSATSAGNEIALERAVAEMLDGARLVCEINITEDLHERVAQSINRLVRYKPDFDRIETLYPATFVVYLVAEGLQRWDGGFWDNLRVPLNPHEAGPAFVRCLERLGLPVFEEELREGFRYVSRILLHGGIPRYCAADVLRLIGKTLETTPGEATDLLARWRQTTSAFESLDKPAQRFLLYGGGDSIALVDRIVEMFRRSALGDGDGFEDIGLPDYLVEEYKLLPSAIKRSGKGLVRPRPRLELAAGGGGPVVVLPPHPGAGTMEWVVDTGERNVARPGSSSEVQVVPLEPYGRWQVDLTDGSKQYHFDFQANTVVPVVLFDGSTRAWVRTPERLQEGTVLALAPARYEFRLGGPDGALAGAGHEHPPLDGRWARHQVKELLVRAGQRLWFGVPQDGEAPARTVSVTRAPVPPVVLGERLEGVRAEGSAPVYVGTPEICIDEVVSKPTAYTVRVTSLTESRTVKLPLRQLERGMLGFRLPEPGELPQLFELNVLGPLGSELRRYRFATVPPGSTSDVPLELIAPDTTVRVSVIIGCSDAEATLAPGQTMAQLPAFAGPLKLGVEIARLTWGASRRGLASPFSVDTIALAGPDLRPEENLNLLVNAAPGATVTVSLVAEGTVLQSVSSAVKGDGRLVTFPLAGFADSVAAAEQGRLHFRIDVTSDGQQLQSVVATVAAQFEVTDLVVQWTPEGGGALDASWTENRLFPDRALLLWSATEAEAAPVVLPIPAGARGRASWPVGASEICGPYFAEIAIHDGWEMAVRPDSLAGTCYVDIGRGGGADPAGADPVGPAPAQLIGRVWGSSSSASTDDAYLRAAATWLANLVARFGGAAVERPETHALREVIFEDPDAGVLALLDLAGSWPHTRRDLQALSLLLADDALTVPAKELTEAQWLDLGVELPVLWAAMQMQAPPAVWRCLTGWNPDPGNPPLAGSAIRLFFLNWSPGEIEDSIAKLRENTLGSERDPCQPLSWGRQQLGLFTWLLTQNPGHGNTIAWQKRWANLHDSSVGRLCPPAAGAMSRLRSPEGLKLDTPRDRVTQFPADLLAASVHLVVASPRRMDALRALMDASRFAPLLTERALLSVLAMVRLQNGAR